MANLNKVLLIGRLTRDPEVRTFSNGGKVAKFGFAVNNRKKNMQTGQWEEEPVFIEVDAFDRGEYRLADIVAQYFTKGKQLFIEGHLRWDQWNDQQGQKRSMLRVRMEKFEFLESKGDGTGGGGNYDSGYSSGYNNSAPPANASGTDGGPAESSEFDQSIDYAAGPKEENIPF